MKIRKKILFVAAAHGDEPIGVEAIKKIKKVKLATKFDWLVANPKALKKNARFIDADMNRVYPGSKDGNNEVRQAFKVLNKARQYDYVIDLHGTVSKTGIFAIITKLNKKTLGLALKFDIKKIVIWPESSESSGSLSTFMDCGIEIESGPKNNSIIEKKLEKLITKFLNKMESQLELDREIKKKEFFTVIGKIIAAKNNPKYRDWKKAGNFYPIFVNQYDGIKCYKLKKINIFRYLK